MPRPMKDLLEHARVEHTYGWVLSLTAIIIVLTIALPETTATRALLIVLTGMNLAVAAAVSQAAPWVVRLVFVGVVIGVTGGLGLLLGSGDSRGVASLTTALLVLATPLVMARGLVRALRSQGVTVKVILGALTFYLLIGLFFGMAYGVVAWLSPDPVFADGQGDGDLSSRLYFAFTTQTTVGYGDFAPATGWMRAFAMSQALIGQLYLVTVLSLLVSNVGRRPGGRRGADAADPAEG